MTVVTAILVSCGTTRTVPITGRKQNLLVTDEQVLSLSNKEYASFMQSATLSSDATNTAMVKRVGQRLASAVQTYLTNNGMAAEVQNFSWEFNLVKNNEANAFCMPGGKIVVYEGLPYTKDEPSLAIVLGHEIAHAVAKHSAEQMSKQIKNQYGTQILGSVLSAAGVGSTTTQLAQIIAQKGLQFRSLKYSRDNETEADRMGLIFAAMAGYDPNVAVSFWQRMSQGSSNQSDMFSDHPSDAKRIAAIKAEMPEALKYYKPVQTVSTAKSTATKKTTAKKTTAKKTVTRKTTKK